MSVAAGLRGAMLLATGRPEGALRLADGSGGSESGRRSFVAILICLPALVLLRAAAWSLAGWPDRPTHAAGLEALGYLVSWLGFAVALHAVFSALGIARAWGHAIAAWNWCNVVQFALALVAVVPDMLNAPAIIGETATLVALGWGAWIEWYAFRVVLGAPWLAVSLVALDWVIGQFVEAAVLLLR